MNRNRMWWIPGLALAVALTAAPVLAQQGTPDNGQAGGTPTQTPQETPPQAQQPPQAQNTPTPGTPAVIQAGTTANENASAEAQARLQEIMDRARKTSPKVAETTDKQLATHAKTVDTEATAKGDQTVAGRLATEFGTTPDALMSEKAQFNTGWGDLMIAHTLMANSKTAVTLDELYQMRTQQGMGWGQIANGLDLRLGEVVSATKAESRVATGLSKPDGKPARISSASVHASGKAGVGAATENTKAGAAARVGAGADVTLPKGHSGK